MPTNRSSPGFGQRGEIRRRILAWRQSLGTSDCAQMGRSVARRCLEMPELGAAAVVCCYLSMPGEVPTSELCLWVLGSGRRLVVPRVERGASQMTLHEIRDLDAEVSPGLWGIPTPHLDRPLVPPADIDLALVPGLAFDGARHRLGFGAGHYDRFLAAAAPITSIGLFFSAQRVDTCHPQEWDVPLTRIVTERGVV